MIRGGLKMLMVGKSSSMSRRVETMVRGLVYNDTKMRIMVLDDESGANEVVESMKKIEGVVVKKMRGEESMAQELGEAARNANICTFNDVATEETFSKQVHNVNKKLMLMLLMDGFEGTSEERAVASVLRSNVCIVQNDFEKMLLETKFDVQHAVVVPPLVEDNEIAKSIQLLEQMDVTRKARTGSVIFEGSFRHACDRENLKYLVEEVCPELFERMPQIFLDVIGEGMDKELLSYLSRYRRIRASGHLPHSKPSQAFRSRAFACINPVVNASVGKWNAPYNCLRLMPTVTNSKGAEGLLNTTYDVNRDISNIDLQDKYYKPSKPRTHAYDETLIKFYQTRNVNLLPKSSYSSFGRFDISSSQDYVDEIEKLWQDGEYWRQEVRKGLEICEKRCNNEIYDRMLHHIISDHHARGEQATLNNKHFHTAWSFV